MPDPVDKVRLGQRVCNYEHANATGGSFYRCDVPEGTEAPEGVRAFDIVSVSPEDTDTRTLVERVRPPMTNQLDIGGGHNSCGVVLRPTNRLHQDYVCRDGGGGVKRVSVSRLHIGPNNSQSVGAPRRNDDATRVLVGILTDANTQITTASRSTGNIHGTLALGEHSGLFRITEGDPASVTVSFADGAAITLGDPHVVDLMRQRALGQAHFSTTPPRSEGGFKLK